MVNTDFHPFLGKLQIVSSFEIVQLARLKLCFEVTCQLLCIKIVQKREAKILKCGRHQSHSVKTFMLNKCQLIAERQKPESHVGRECSTQEVTVDWGSLLHYILLKVILVFEYNTPIPCLSVPE